MLGEVNKKTQYGNTQLGKKFTINEYKFNEFTELFG